MRILHVADLHLRWFDWVKTHAKAFDLLVIAGDLQDAFSDVPMAQQARHCRDWLLTLETPTVVVSGNHDYYVKTPHVTFDALAEALWLRSLGGKNQILAVDGETVPFPSDRPEVTISTIGWAQKTKWDKNTDILVAHAPPCGVDLAYEPGGSRDLGDSDLWLALLHNPPPRLILCGHIHHARRYWSRWPAENPHAPTTILLPGCDETAPEPQRWEIDLAASQATWHGDGELTVEI
jgi:Icc-related predicted phosphoesterase